jgi:hypothetical protein
MESSKPKKEKPKKETVQSALEKYEIIEIRRDQMKNADYNPRSITAKAKKRLKENIKNVGLLAPIVWNKRTGNIVSGHQRVDCLDQLEKTHEYMIRVSAVDLDEKTEREQNVFMNNADVQGTFDVEKLGEMWKGENAPDAYAMGFDQSDVYHILGENLNEEQIESMAALSNEMHKAIKAFDDAAKSSNDRNDSEFYLVVVFKNRESRADFCNRHGIEDFRYVDGRELESVIESAGQIK